MILPEPRCQPFDDHGRYPPSQPTEEELAQIIYDAVLHCIQYKAKAIEAAEQFNRERANHEQ